MGDETRLVRTGPKQDVTRTRTNNDAGDDVVTNRRQADEHKAEHLRSSGTDSSRKITTKCEPCEVRDEQTSITEQHVPRSMTVKTTQSEHTIEVTTQEATDGYRWKTMRISHVETNTLNSVPSSLAVHSSRRIVASALDRHVMKRDIMEMRQHDVFTESDKNQSRGWRKEHKDHMEFLCDLYDAQVASGRYCVHEQTSAAHSRMCVARIIVMPNTRTYVSKLCMLGLAAIDEGGSGFVNASVRAVTNARQFGMRMPAKCTGTHRHTRVGSNNASEKMEHSGVVRAMVEQLMDEQELTLWE